MTGDRSCGGGCGDGGLTTSGGGRLRDKLVAWYGSGCRRLLISCWVFKSRGNATFSGLSLGEEEMVCRRLSAFKTVPFGDNRCRPSVLMNLPSAVMS